MIIAHYDHEKNLSQSLMDHSFQTAILAAKLGREAGLEQVSFLVGLLHDVGKADRIFQKKILENSKKKVIHSSAGLKYILSFMELAGGGDELWREYIEVLAYVVGAHHSVFDIPGQDENFRWISRLYDKANYDRNNYHYSVDVLTFVKDLDEKLYKDHGYKIHDVLEKGFLEYQSSKKLLRPVDKDQESFYTGLYVRLILSFLKNADVVDTINAYEEILSIPEEETYDSYRSSYLKKIEGLYESYGQANSRINEIRTLAADRARDRGKEDSPGIYRLDLPTGAGKTQISLRYGIHQFYQQKKSRIFYVTPFLSVLEQNAQVIKDILKEGVLEHHSNIVSDEEFFDGNMSSEEFEDESEAYRFHQYLLESWDSPVVVTTMVQFFNSLFKTRASNLRRFSSLVNSVIIMDEVQSLPIKVTYLFNSMMNFMSQVMGVTVVHCTATQPNYDFHRLRYPIEYGGSAEPDLVELSKEEREVFDRTEIYLLKGGGKAKLQDIYEEINEYPKDSFLVVLNTKAAVEKLYDLCKESSTRKVFYLSTNLCPAHRRERIDEIRERLAANEPLVCISTQLIEAGVDLDFNRLIRSYAGIDSIIQAAGRCNREGKLKEQKGIVKLAFLSKHIENLGSLRDIKLKKDIAREILMDYGDEKIEVKEINDRFFERYYINSEPELYYRLENGENLYDLLAGNEDYQLGVDHDLALRQSFARGGRSFELIKNNTQAVIVPYKEGKDKLMDLEEAIEIYKKEYSPEAYQQVQKRIRALQPYSVNLYNTKGLGNSITSLLDGDILVLFEGNYNQEKGLVLEEDHTLFQI